MTPCSITVAHCSIWVSQCFLTSIFYWNWRQWCPVSTTYYSHSLGACFRLMHQSQINANHIVIIFIYLSLSACFLKFWTRTLRELFYQGLYCIAQSKILIKIIHDHLHAITPLDRIVFIAIRSSTSCVTVLKQNTRNVSYIDLFSWNRYWKQNSTM